MSNPATVSPITGPPAGMFQGSRMVAISDADMVASAYIDAQLGPHEPTEQDMLTVIELPLAFDGRPVTMGSVAASNSVTGPPRVLALDPSGMRAYVIETLGRRTPQAQKLTDLPPGSMVRAYDIADPSNPQLLFAGDAGYMPQAVSLHPDGQLLAIAGADVFSLHGDAQPSLRLLPVEQGGFGDPAVLEPQSEQGEAIVPCYVEWHPDGQIVAACFPWRDEVRLYAARRTPELRLEPLGPPIATSKFPFSGRFTPDGRYFITTDVQWGQDVDGIYGDPPSGRLSVLRIDAAAGTGEKVGEATVGQSPEGLAISPDGRHVVTSNLRRSFRPWSDERLDRQSSLSLLTFDPDSGNLETTHEELFDGILPEGPAFDKDGKFVAVAVFDHFDLAHPRGELRFWELVEDGARPQLRSMHYSLEVMRGPHTLEVV